MKMSASACRWSDPSGTRVAAPCVSMSRYRYQCDAVFQIRQHRLSQRAVMSTCTCACCRKSPASQFRENILVRKKVIMHARFHRPCAQRRRRRQKTLAFSQRYEVLPRTEWRGNDEEIRPPEHQANEMPRILSFPLHRARERPLSFKR